MAQVRQIGQRLNITSDPHEEDDAPVAEALKPTHLLEPDDSEEIDPETVAEIFYGLYGEQALEILQQLQQPDDEVTESRIPLTNGLVLLEGWDAASHPRGKGGRFIPKGSSEAVQAAKDVVSKVIRGDRTADPKELLDHLSILTVQQIRDIGKAHGKKIPKMLREELVGAVAALLGGGQEKPAEPVVAPEPTPEPAAASAEPVRGVQDVLRDTRAAERQLGRLKPGDSRADALLQRIKDLDTERASLRRPAREKPQAEPRTPLATGKPPHEMTRQEWERERDNAMVPNHRGVTPNEHARLIARQEELHGGIKGEYDPDLGRTMPVSHEDVVRAAITQGKLVPPEVLADYPDLAPKAAPPAPAPVEPVAAPAVQPEPPAAPAPVEPPAPKPKAPRKPRAKAAPKEQPAAPQQPPAAQGGGKPPTDPGHPVHAAFNRLDGQEGARNFVYLADLKKQLPGMSQADFADMVQQLRRSGQYEARIREVPHPDPKRDAEILAASLPETGRAGSTERLITLHRKPAADAPKPAPPPVARPAPAAQPAGARRSRAELEPIQKKQPVSGSEYYHTDRPDPKWRDKAKAVSRGTAQAVPDQEPLLRSAGAKDVPRQDAVRGVMSALDDAKLLTEYRDGVVDMPILYEMARNAGAAMPLEQFHETLMDLWKNRNVELHVMNGWEKAPPEFNRHNIRMADAIYGAVMMRQPATGEVPQTARVGG